MHFIRVRPPLISAALLRPRLCRRKDALPVAHAWRSAGRGSPCRSWRLRDEDFAATPSLLRHCANRDFPWAHPPAESKGVRRVRALLPHAAAVRLKVAKDNVGRGAPCP